MGTTAENVAKKYDISRNMQEEFAVESHYKASKAAEQGAFHSEIISIETTKGNSPRRWMHQTRDKLGITL